MSDSYPPPPPPSGPGGGQGGWGPPPGGGGYDAGGYGSGGYGSAPPPPPGGPGSYGYGRPAGPPPDNYLVWAILSTVLCCLPLGIVSIVYAAQVNSKWAMGDVAGAQESSRKARLWAIWSAVALLILVVLYFLGVAALIGFSGSTAP